MSSVKFINPMARTWLALISISLASCGAGSDKSASGPAGKPADGADAQNQAASETAPQRSVVSDRLPYGEVDEELVYGYFVFPSDMIEPLPAIILLHEWWGLNDTMREWADQLAAEGYIVLAVDLYQGKTASSPAAARELMTQIVENPEAAEINIRSAYEFVTETAGAPRTGVVGWGLGGTWSLNTAMLFPDELDAAVVYYGQVISDEDKLRPVDAPLLAFFGGKDRTVSSESVENFDASLQRLRKNFEIETYPGVGTGFSNPTNNNFDRKAADDSWGRMLEFLKLHLRVENDA